MEKKLRGYSGNPWLSPHLTPCILPIFSPDHSAGLRGQAIRHHYTLVHQLYRGLESPQSPAKGVVWQGRGQDWRMEGAGHWSDHPSGSDLRNSRPCWPCEAILNCYNYRVSLGQWHHGVWALLTPPGATLGMGGGCSVGEGDPSGARGGAWKTGSGGWRST